MTFLDLDWTRVPEYVDALPGSVLVSLAYDINSIEKKEYQAWVYCVLISNLEITPYDMISSTEKKKSTECLKYCNCAIIRCPMYL